MSSLSFAVKAKGRPAAYSNNPNFLLYTDNWDDFGNKVQFHLYHVDSRGRETRLGALKILHRVSSGESTLDVEDITRLPAEFSALGDDYISLGQEDDYYKIAFSKLGERSHELFRALGDIALNPQLALPFEPHSAFRNALMRENGASRARRFGRAWATGQAVRDKLSFTYLGEIPGAIDDVEATFAFNAKDPVPGRISCIIGRNAVGKTQFLASLGNDLTQISRSSAKSISDRERRFPDGRPLFTRVIAISYSAFDKFKRPTKNLSASYIYCGIRTDKGGLSRVSLRRNYEANRGRIAHNGQNESWARHVRSVLGDLDEKLKGSLTDLHRSPTEKQDTLAQLSSGQSILVHFVTALLAWIQPNSLVLFDEPETHLHPNAVASLFLVLTDILDEFDSYAIVATHSPVVLQEVPAKRVLLFERTDNLTTASALRMESFGESVSELTKHVFETIEVPSVYRRTLKELSGDEDLPSLLRRFPLGLSLNAQAYLLAQYSRRAKSKK